MDAERALRCPRRGVAFIHRDIECRAHQCDRRMESRRDNCGLIERADGETASRWQSSSRRSERRVDLPVPILEACPATHLARHRSRDAPQARTQPVDRTGLEPVTSSVSWRRASQLRQRSRRQARSIANQRGLPMHAYRPLPWKRQTTAPHRPHIPQALRPQRRWIPQADRLACTCACAAWCPALPAWA